MLAYATDEEAYSLHEQQIYIKGIDIDFHHCQIAILDENDTYTFSQITSVIFANIQETLAELLTKAYGKLGELTLHPVITRLGGLPSPPPGVPFVQEVIAVSTSLQKIAPQTDVAIELGGEDAKIIYFEGGNIEQRMNGICAGGTGSFIDQMASLLQTDATGLNEYAKNYKALYPIAARCGVFAKTDIQPLINDGATKEDLSACFPGSCKPDHFRSCLRQADPRSCCISRRSPSLSGSAEGCLYPYPEAG